MRGIFLAQQKIHTLAASSNNILFYAKAINGYTNRVLGKLC